MGRSNNIRLIGLGAAVIGLFVAGLLLPIETWALDLIETIRDLGPAGWAVFIAVYIAVTVALIPASVLTLGAGFVYGLAGALLVWPGAMIGAGLAFFIGRRVARGYVADKISGTTRFRAIDDVVGDSGLKITTLLRLSPLFPFGLLNYGLSLTRIRARDYLLATGVGIIPGMFMYIYFGSSAANLAAVAEGDATDTTADRVAFWAGLAITVAVTIWVTRLARRRVREILDSRVGEDVDGAEEQVSGGPEEPTVPV